VAHAPSNVKDKSFAVKDKSFAVKDKSFAFIAIVIRPPGKKTLVRAAFTIV
jgi:hypothetical protein